MGEESLFKFSLQSKNALYLNFEAALFREPDYSLRFSYPVDHPLAAEFENHPDEQGAVDDAPTAQR